MLLLVEAIISMALIIGLILIMVPVALLIMAIPKIIAYIKWLINWNFGSKF